MRAIAFLLGVMFLDILTQHWATKSNFEGCEIAVVILTVGFTCIDVLEVIRKPK